MKNEKGINKSLRNIWRLFKMIWNIHPRFTLVVLVLRTVQAVLPVCILYVGKIIIDEIVRLINLEQVIDTATDLETMKLWVLIGLGLSMLTGLISRLLKLINSLLGDLISIRTTGYLIEHAATLDLYQFENPDFYDKLQRAKQEKSGRTAIINLVFRQVQDVVTISALIAALLTFSLGFVVFLILIVLPIYFAENHFNKKTYSLIRNWTPEKRELSYLKYLGTNERTIKEIKVFGLERFVLDRFNNLSERFYSESKKLAIKQSVYGILFTMISIVAYYGAYVFVLYETVTGVISIGTMTFLAGGFQRMQGILENSALRLSRLSKLSLFLQDFFDFLETPPLIQHAEGKLPMPDKIKKGFEFENVSFTYHGSEKPALKNLSFTLKAGEKLALVGENGAGKTTIVKLLARLYIPTEGRILLDGIDISEYDAKEYTSKIGVIFQDYVKYNFTAKENIAVGHIDEIDNQALIEKAAEKSLAGDIIENLENRYDQMLGKRFSGGVGLSGGQWQKFALARSYMRDAQLVILDEPTAALDARAEYEVFLRFSELMQERTAVIISHRFSTVRMADRILFLKNATKQEFGSHEELMANDGTYAELFKMQAQGYL